MTHPQPAATPTSPTPATSAPASAARPGSAPRRSRLDRLRRGLAAFAAFTTLPYLGLKTVWMLGSRVGISDPGFGHSTTLLVLNALTAGLDVVALALAVCLFRGVRLPAWLLLPPLWVGSGLLGQILVALPLTVLAQAGPSRPGTGEVPPLDAWVYLLVYGGFFGLGVGLLGAFAVHAGQRWGSGSPRPARPAARALLRLAVAACLGAGALHLWLSDVPLGTRALDLVVAVVAAGALGLLAVPGLGRRATRAAVVLAFVGTGAMAAWGTYLGVLNGIPNELVGRTSPDLPTVVASAARLAAGLLGAGALALRLRKP